VTAVRFHRHAAGLRIRGPADFTPISRPAAQRKACAGRTRTARQVAAQRQLYEAIAAHPRDTVPCLVSDPEARRRWTSDDPTEAEKAAKDCRSCPVRLLCRAVGRSEPSGVWGGTVRSAKTDKGKAA
jgi:hypothetical protein